MKYNWVKNRRNKKKLYINFEIDNYTIKIFYNPLNNQLVLIRKEKNEENSELI